MIGTLAFALAAASLGASCVGVMALRGAARAGSAIVWLASIVALTFEGGFRAAYYGTAQGVWGMTALGVAGSTFGYLLATGLLAGWERRTPRPIVSPETERTGVVVLAVAEPDRYDPCSELSVLADLTAATGVTIPVMLLPLSLLSRRARYRPMRHATAARDQLDALVHATATGLGGNVSVDSAVSHGEADLAAAVHRLAGRDCARVVVVTLGFVDSEPFRRALTRAERATPPGGGPHLVAAEPIWHDDHLAAEIAGLILEQVDPSEGASVGVALVTEGHAGPWSERHPRGAEEENYFCQRVRLHLGEHGIADGLIRAGAASWQDPDVTETVRHLAALGCERILVAPVTMPVMAPVTALDIEASVEMARVPGSVSITILHPSRFAEPVSAAVVRSARRALDADASTR